MSSSSSVSSSISSDISSTESGNSSEIASSSSSIETSSNVSHISKNQSESSDVIRGGCKVAFSGNMLIFALPLLFVAIIQLKKKLKD